MKTYIRPSLSFSLALLLIATPVFAAPSRGNANNGAVRSSSRSNVNQPSRNASSNRSANDNRNSNRNTNVNKNANVNVNRDVNVNTHTSYNNG